MSDETMAIRRDSVSWVVTDESVVVLDLRTSSYLSLNESGSALWQQLAEGATLDQLEDGLVERFGIDRVVARADAESFVAALQERQLLDLP